MGRNKSKGDNMDHSVIKETCKEAIEEFTGLEFEEVQQSNPPSLRLDYYGSKAENDYFFSLDDLELSFNNSVTEFEFSLSDIRDVWASYGELHIELGTRGGRLSTLKIKALNH
jgi:5'-deoxynucleotidase YfbR-like HD superfamily hydrolase